MTSSLLVLYNIFEKCECSTVKPPLWIPAYYGHLIITDSLLCPWGNKAPTFSLNSTRLIRTPRYYRQFALPLGK